MENTKTDLVDRLKKINEKIDFLLNNLKRGNSLLVSHKKQKQ